MSIPVPVYRHWLLSCVSMYIFVPVSVSDMIRTTTRCVCVCAYVRVVGIQCHAVKYSYVSACVRVCQICVWVYVWVCVRGGYIHRKSSLYVPCRFSQLSIENPESARRNRVSPVCPMKFHRGSPWVSIPSLMTSRQIKTTFLINMMGCSRIFQCEFVCVCVCACVFKCVCVWLYDAIQQNV